MRASYDVVIIGGAAIGSSIAFFLSRSTTFSGSVLVLEKDLSYTKCSTTLSLASIRQQFSTPVNILASAFSIDFIKKARAKFGTPGDIGFDESGYLITASSHGATALRANYKIQHALGTESALLSPEQIAQRFPWMSTKGIGLACLGLSGEGLFDPYSLLNLYISEANPEVSIIWRPKCQALMCQMVK